MDYSLSRMIAASCGERDLSEGGAFQASGTMQLECRWPAGTEPFWLTPLKRLPHKTLWRPIGRVAYNSHDPCRVETELLTKSRPASGKNVSLGTGSWCWRRKRSKGCHIFRFER